MGLTTAKRSESFARKVINYNKQRKAEMPILKTSPLVFYSVIAYIQTLFFQNFLRDLPAFFQAFVKGRRSKRFLEHGKNRIG